MVVAAAAVIADADYYIRINENFEKNHTKTILKPKGFEEKN